MTLSETFPQDRCETFANSQETLEIIMADLHLIIYYYVSFISVTACT